MKIVDKEGDRRPQSNLFWLLLVTGALVAGILLGNAGAISTLEKSWENSQRRLTGLTTAAALPLLTANIDFEAYNQILGDRESAIEQGVLFPQDSTYVSAEIQQGNERVPVWIRLLPGSASHLGTDEKWNYELLTRDDAMLSGMSHANLIDPAENSWLNQWVFLESLRREGLHAADYQFVNLILNGDDKGVYALQESPGPLVSSTENDLGSVVLGYDAEPLLEAVSYFGDVGSAVADPISNVASSDPRFLQVAEIDDPLVTEDDLLSQQADRATALLRGLQSGDLAASEVFDVEQYGRFLALVDLWGAGDALSPFNLTYVYDNQNDLLRPIITNANPLDAAYRVPPAAMYQDPAVQAAYASFAAEYSDPTYLADLRAAVEPDHTGLEQALAAEGDNAPLWDELAARQEQLRLSLRPAQPVIAQLGSPALAQDAIIRVHIANTLNFPLEILGFDIDGATFLETNPEWLVDGEPHYEIVDDRIILKPVAADSAGLRFVTFDLPVTQIIEQDQELDFLNEIQIQVATSVLGVEDTQLTPASPGLLNGP